MSHDKIRNSGLSFSYMLRTDPHSLTNKEAKRLFLLDTNRKALEYWNFNRRRKIGTANSIRTDPNTFEQSKPALSRRSDDGNLLYEFHLVDPDGRLKRFHTSSPAAKTPQLALVGTLTRTSASAWLLKDWEIIALAGSGRSQKESIVMRPSRMSAQNAAWPTAQDAILRHAPPPESWSHPTLPVSASRARPRTRSLLRQRLSGIIRFVLGLRAKRR